MLRRSFFVIPFHYTSPFVANNPYLMFEPSSENEEQAWKAFDADSSTYMVAPGIGDEVVLTTNSDRAVVQGYFFEPTNWDTAVYKQIFFDYGETGAYANTAEIEEVFYGSDVSIVGGNSVYVEYDDLPVLAIFRVEVVNQLYMRFRIEGATSGESLLVSGIWVGRVYEMDHQHSTGWQMSNEAINYEHTNSISGVPLKRIASASSVIYKKTIGLTYEWITSAQMESLLDIYTYVQGIRPFKYIQIDEISGMTHYTVVFNDAPKVQQVADGYYTVTISLREA